ncbi:MAG: protein-glutamate O-methyltransferase CheR [Gemmatimonadota bacterium]|nr:MAG: protein-glutamate O-methyltransferase CheR [Gemmatimonadota bacterium]
MTVLLSPYGAIVQMEDEAYHLLNEFMEQRLGLYFPEQRRPILENRLQPRLRTLNLESFLDYYLLLRTSTDGELSQLARAVTNNETYLFREAGQFDALFDHALPDLRSHSVDRDSLRVLSAGCSSGEEAYTISFYAKDRVPLLPIQIDAFDLDQDRLEIARRGSCRRRSLREMSPAQVDRYLIAEGEERFTVRPRYRSGVTFRFGNLVDPRSFAPEAPYDVVFCRNVLIYFSDRTMRRAIQNLANVLRPGGLLFLGHSESIIGMFSNLETTRLGDIIAYRKAGS